MLKTQELVRANGFANQIRKLEAQIEALEQVIELDACDQNLTRDLESKVAGLERELYEHREARRAFWVIMREAGVSDLVKRYGQDVVSWPNNAKTREYFVTCALIEGFFSDQARQVMGIPGD